jgi:hypothetical protein
VNSPPGSKTPAPIRILTFARSRVGFVKSGVASTSGATV